MWTVQACMHARRCVTFESPGLIKFWRKKASDRDEDYWRERIVNYLTFPSAPGAAPPRSPLPRRRPVCASLGTACMWACCQCRACSGCNASRNGGHACRRR